MARQCYRKAKDDTTTVCADGGVRIPKNITTTLGLKHGQKIRFVVMDKEHLTATAGNKENDRSINSEVLTVIDRR